MHVFCIKLIIKMRSSGVLTGWNVFCLLFVGENTAKVKSNRSFPTVSGEGADE